MCIKIKKRNFIKIFTFILATFVIASIFAVTGWSGYMSEKQVREYSYQRSLLSLSETVDSIDVTLRKTLCAGSAEQFAALAAKLCTDAATAKSELSQLPISVGELDNVNRFISQVGNYAVSLSEKRYLDEDLSNDELKQLKELEKYTAKLRLTLDEVIARSADSGLWPGDSKNFIGAEAVNAENEQAGASIDVMAEDFTDYPTLIYDGPFSDHIYDKKPMLIKNKERVSTRKACDTARAFSENDNLKYTRSVEGNLPLYIFEAEGIEAGVTVQGGEMAYMINSRAVNSTRLDEEDAERIARRYLNDHGYSNMRGNYYEINSNCCVMSFTSVAEDVVFYPDMIKIVVALDNGEVVELDARDYIMNHHDRGSISPERSMQEARKIVSRQLEIENTQLALIPTGGKEEKLCWEFLCEVDDDTEVLVYINADNLTEERILLILEDENGKLTI